MKTYQQAKRSNEIVMGLSFVFVATSVLACMAIFAATA
tara:strand:+ start:617 stop:730 length:114 start_codon:yes stop_codon:yes gene_type:complete